MSLNPSWPEQCPCLDSITPLRTRGIVSSKQFRLCPPTLVKSQWGQALALSMTSLCPLTYQSRRAQLTPPLVVAYGESSTSAQKGTPTSWGGGGAVVTQVEGVVALSHL